MKVILSVGTTLKDEKISKYVLFFYFIYFSFYQNIYTATKNLQSPDIHLKYSWEKRREKNENEIYITYKIISDRI